MKFYILVLMFLTILFLLFRVKDILKDLKIFLQKIEIKKLLLLMGGLHIVIPFMLSISTQGFNLVSLFVVFIVGACYIFYATSHHFDKMCVIRSCREYIDNQSPTITNLNDNDINTLIYYADIQEHTKIIEDLTDIKDNTLFRMMNFEFIKQYCLQWANENIELESIPHFMNLVAGKEIAEKVRLKSRAKKSKELTYRPLFDFFNYISYLGVNRLVSDERNRFINFICSNFAKGEKNIFNKTLNSRFSTWKNSHSIGEKHHCGFLGYT